ncbi:MAG: hypothetical protein ACI4IS_02900 [Acutalibacteraceae bacterium]
MAYPIEENALKLFTKPYLQTVSITFYGTADTFEITEADIVQGGLSINRYCVSGSRIETGSAIASELKLLLDNSDGRYDDTVFEGAELYVKIGIKKWDAQRWENAQLHYIPLGYFTVDEAPRKLRQISLTALDRMMMFDKKVNWSGILFPVTVGGLIDIICAKCSVMLGESRENLKALPNYGYKINTAPNDEDLTYRQLLSYMGQITGTCAFIDWDGRLRLKWYEETNTEINLSNRFDSDLQEKKITITGIEVSDGENVYLKGTDGYTISIDGNSLIQHDYQTVATALYNKLGGFTYTPFSAVVKPMPHIYPLDIITFVDKKGTKHKTIITDCTFTLNGNTEIEGKGETATNSGYATSNPLTKKEKEIVEKMLTARQQSTLSLNETICNALGLWRTEAKQADGSVIYYFHNTQDIENSSVIYTYNSGGFAWTDSWNDGNPVWLNGIDRNGNAVLNIISAYKITAEMLDATYVDEVNNKITSLKTKIDAITAEVSDGTSGTSLTLSPNAVQLAWNNVSRYIKLENAQLNIYNSSDIKLMSLNQYGQNIYDSTGSLLMSLDQYGQGFFYNSKNVGRVGTNRYAGNEDYRGIEFDLENSSAYMSWAYRDSPDGEYYQMKLTYTSKQLGSYAPNTLNAGCPLDMHNYNINNACLKNWSFEGGSTTGTFSGYYVTAFNSDGTAATWKQFSLEFINGILQNATW